MRRLLLSLFISIAICLPLVVGQEIRSTFWTGTLDAGGTRLRIEVELVEADGKLTGQVRSPDQNNTILRMAEIRMDGESLSFSLPQAGASYSGKLSKNGQIATGTFHQSGGEAPLVLSRVDRKSDVPGKDKATSDPLEELGEMVQWYIDKQHAVGAELLVIQKGKTLYHQSFGMSDVEEQRPWENNTLCNIRSMTKPITSAAAQILIDRKLLKLDEPVASYLESFDNDKSGSITVRQVLTHRSGLPLTNLIKVDQFSSLAEQVAAAGEKGPQFEPDSKFWYSDIGTDVVGALVEKISGEPLQEFVQRELFEPLGMTSTLYGIDASDKRYSKAASLYVKVGSKRWTRFWKPDKPFYPFAWGSQTVFSTTADYAKFLTMLMNRGRVGDRQLISVEAVDRMLAPVSRMKMLGSDSNYPTGFRNLQASYGQMMLTHRVIGQKTGNPVIIGHSGSDGTNAWAWPDRELIILYFTQSRGGMTPLKIEKPIDRLVIHPGKNEPVPDRLRPYIGVYIANHEGFDGEEFTVTARNGKLFLDVPSQLEFELMEPDDDGFWAFALVPDQVKAIFDRNEDGDVVGIKLHKEDQVYEVPRKGTDRAIELSLRKTKALAAGLKKQSMETLKEAWVGKLDLGGLEPVMQFRIVTTGSGETSARFDSVTEGRTGFDATWSIDGDVLKFDVAKIELTYRGTLNEARDTAKGTWESGGSQIPLDLEEATHGIRKVESSPGPELLSFSNFHFAR